MALAADAAYVSSVRLCLCWHEDETETRLCFREVWAAVCAQWTGGGDQETPAEPGTGENAHTHTSCPQSGLWFYCVFVSWRSWVSPGSSREQNTCRSWTDRYDTPTCLNHPQRTAVVQLHLCPLNSGEIWTINQILLKSKQGLLQFSNHSTIC